VFLFVASSTDAGGQTALHRAAAEGNVPCLRALLAAGVHVDVEDSQHRTALDLARIRARRHCARSAPGGIGGREECRKMVAGVWWRGATSDPIRGTTGNCHFIS